MNKHKTREPRIQRLLLVATLSLTLILGGCTVPVVPVGLTPARVVLFQGETATVLARTGPPECHTSFSYPPCDNIAGLQFQYDVSGVPPGMGISFDNSLQSPATPGLVRMTVHTDASLPQRTYELAVHATLNGTSLGASTLRVSVLASASSVEGDVVGIGAGRERSFAILDDGTALAWGMNYGGALGTGQAFSVPVMQPLLIPDGVQAISANFSMLSTRSAAVSSSGNLWLWGDNDRELLIPGHPREVRLPRRHPGLSDISSASVGDTHMLALSTDGTVYAWGENMRGQLGDGTTLARSVPTPVSGLPPVRAIAAGSGLSLALDESGSVWAWGDNQYGELGQGDTFVSSFSAIPIRVPGIAGVADISTGSGFVLAGMGDGTLMAWGKNDLAQLGNTSIANLSAPTQVAGVDQTIDTAAGFDFGLALRDDGTLWGWGGNRVRQLQTREGEEQHLWPAPAHLRGVSDVVQVAVGRHHTLILAGCGQLMTFGRIPNGLDANGGSLLVNSGSPRLIPGTGRPGECERAALQVGRAGPDAFNGTVTSSDVILECADDRCPNYDTVAVPRNELVSLVAHAGEDSRFVRWAGDCQGSQPLLVISIDAPTRCVAVFDSTRPTPTLLRVSATAGNVTSSEANNRLGPHRIDCGNTCSAVFDEDTQVSLLARPDPGFGPVQWTGDCTGTAADTSVVMTTSKRCEAQFRAFEISVQVNGEGTVSSVPEGIVCTAGACTLTPQTNPALLTATPSPGWVLGSWSGDCAGSSSTAQLEMTADRVCTVSFQRDAAQRFLRVEVLGDPGSVQSVPAGIDACRTDCTALFPTGSTVQLTATPDEGNRVVAWVGDCSAPGPVSSPVVMDQDRGCGIIFQDIDDPQVPVAEFTRPPATPRVGEPVRFDGSTSYVFDPDTGISDPLLIRSYEWDFDLDGVFDVGGNGTQARVVEHVFQTPGTKIVQLRVTGGTSGPGGSPGQAFEQRQFTVLEADATLDPLTISKSGAGTGRVRSVPAGLIDCDTSCTTSAPVLFARGTVVDLQAIPDTGSTFVSWHAQCGGNSPQVQVTLLGARHCLALFAVETVTLQVSRIGDGLVTSFQTGIQCGSDCSESYDHGTAVTLTATPAQGFQFDGWSGSCGGTTPTTVVTMNGDRNCHASFSPSLATFTLSVGFLGGTPGRIVVADPLGSSIDCGTICTDVFPAGTTVRLRSEFVPGTFFGGWAAGCDAIVDQQCLVTLSSDRNVTAIFE